MLFVGEASDYVPVPALRTRNLPTAPEDVDWRLPVESWDREYRRFRFNTTRVQRKYLKTSPQARNFCNMGMRNRKQQLHVVMSELWCINSYSNTDFNGYLAVTADAMRLYLLILPWNKSKTLLHEIFDAFYLWIKFRI